MRMVFYAVNDIGKLFLTAATADTGEYSDEDAAGANQDGVLG